MSSSIHLDLLNLKSKLTVGDSSSSSRRLVEDLQKKHESRINQDTPFNINVLDRLAEDHFSSILIPDQQGTKGMKALKIISHGNCLNNLPCLHLRPFTLRCVYVLKNFGIRLVMVFKVSSHLEPPSPY